MNDRTARAKSALLNLAERYRIRVVLTITLVCPRNPRRLRMEAL